MKKSLIVVALALFIALALAGCGEKCDHDWKQADCKNAKTCQLCGKTQGDPLGHSWKPATCSSPKTCEACGVTEGGVRGHSWKDATCQDPKICTTCGTTEGEEGNHTWKDANCMAAKTCTTCGLTEGGMGEHELQEATCDAPVTCAHCGLTVGEALGHDWGEQDCEKPKTCLTCGWTEEIDPENPGAALPAHVWEDATCEEPKHCANCDKIEGEALGHKWETSGNYKVCSACGELEGGAANTDDRFQADKCKMLFGSWKGEVTLTAGDLGLTSYEGSVTEVMTITFNPDGTSKKVVAIKDMNAYVNLMTAYMFEVFASMGLNEQQAEDATMAEYGMTVRQYATKTCEENNNVATENVYYVSGNKLYTGESWDSDMSAAKIEVEDDAMILHDPDLKQDVEFARI